MKTRHDIAREKEWSADVARFIQDNFDELLAKFEQLKNQMVTNGQTTAVYLPKLRVPDITSDHKWEIAVNGADPDNPIHTMKDIGTDGLRGE